MIASKKELGWLHAISSGPLALKIAALFTRNCRQYIHNAIEAGILKSRYNNNYFLVNIKEKERPLV